MKKLVITGRDLDFRAVIDLVGKTLMIAGRLYIVAGGVIPQGEVTRYECGLYPVYETTSLEAASRVFRCQGRADLLTTKRRKAARAMRRKELIAVYGAGQWWVVGHNCRRADHTGPDEAKIVNVDVSGTTVCIRFDDGVEIEVPYSSGGAMWRDVDENDEAGE